MNHVHGCKNTRKRSSYSRDALSNLMTDNPAMHCEMANCPEKGQLGQSRGFGAPDAAVNDPPESPEHNILDLVLNEQVMKRGDSDDTDDEDLVLLGWLGQPWLLRV